jgi:hypothetical protein
MKLTKTQLKEIIKEEIKRALNEGQTTVDCTDATAKRTAAQAVVADAERAGLIFDKNLTKGDAIAKAANAIGRAKNVSFGDKWYPLPSCK